MFDYHMHSKPSFDAVTEPAAMIEAAKRAGLKEICFTDHKDTDPLGQKELSFRVEDYLAAYEPYLDGSCGMRVKLGAEIGAAPWDPAAYDEKANDFDYDFIICSAHFVGTEDPYFPSFFENRTREQAFTEYLEEIIRNIKTHDKYSVFGHLTFVSKNCPCEDPIVHYAEFAELYDEIFRLLIARGKGIEVNTSGYRNTGAPLPPYDAVRRYFELGGEIITVGSDAHTPDRVGQNVSVALKCIRDAGGKYVCTFDKMNPVFHKIP